MFEQGEIVLAKFPFSSLESSKRRPCLILAKGDSQEDFIVAFITSTKLPTHFNFSIKMSPQDKYFLESGLKVESFIRVDKVATLHESLISGAIGRISLTAKEEVFTKIKVLYGL